VIFSDSRTTDLRATGRSALLALLIAVFGLVHAVAAEPVPQVDHIVVVILENHSYAQIIRNEKAPFINGLAKSGAMFVNSRAIRRPSQPNYFALFSGSTQGIKDDKEHSRDAPNLATALAQNGKRFRGYADRGVPRKHKPWESFRGSASLGQEMSGFPGDFDQLPDVSFVIPDQAFNMHDGSIRAADNWLKAHLEDYVNHCRDHRCLLILTFDEPGGKSNKNILTIIAGSQVRPGVFAQRIDHYSVLRTITDAMGIDPLGESAKAEPVFGIWKME